jgi:hypothetical protein
MINHARTLLLNTPAKKAQAQDAGYEYIPTEYLRVELTKNLKTIQSTLFGVNPDQRFLNLRAMELLSYAHQTELAEHIFALDPRVTYWPPVKVAFQPTRPIVVTQVGGVHRQLSAAGVFNATNATPVAQRQYFVALTTDDQTATLTDALLTETVDFLTAETAGEVFLQETASGGGGAAQVNALYVKQINSLSEPLIVPLQNVSALPTITLPETQIKITPASLPDPGASNAARWLVDLAADMPPAITTILPALELIGEPAVLELFGVAPEEPYTTFKNLWFEHPLPAYRLAGFVLAYIYRLNERRSNNNG